MSGEGVSVDMFKVWASAQKDIVASTSTSNTNMMTALTAEMKGIRFAQSETTKEMKEITALLRDDINTTKAILNQHIKEYNHNKLDKAKKFDQVFSLLAKLTDTLKAREGMFTTAKYVKWALGIILVGILTASGNHIYTTYALNPKDTAKKGVKYDGLLH